MINDTIRLSTLCYIEQKGKYLMLHRTKKQQDINAGKWIGVGGHFEKHESPEECLLREVREETGFVLTKYRFRGIVTFITPDVTEYMFLYTGHAFSGMAIECDEGDLAWIEKTELMQLHLWEGDRIFLRLLLADADVFSLKLIYDEKDRLCSAVLNGAEQEIDI